MFEGLYSFIDDFYSIKSNRDYEIKVISGLDYRRYPNLKLILEPLFRGSNLPKIRLMFLHNLPNVEDIKSTVNDTIQFARRPDLVKPSDEDQRLNNGYFRNTVGDSIVEWKRIKDEFYLVGYSKDLPHGLIECKPPKSLDNWNNSEPITHEHNYLTDYKLEDGEEIWSWDNLGILSGSSGFLIVKDNLVVKYVVEELS